MEAKRVAAKKRALWVRMAALYTYNTRHGMRYSLGWNAVIAELAEAFQPLADSTLRAIACL